MKLNGPLAVVAASVLWGTAGTAGALAVLGGVDVEPVSLAAARLLMGGVLLAIFTGAPAAITLLTRRGPARVPMLLAALAAAGYQLAFFAAVTRTGVAIGTVVTIGSGPVFTGVLSWLINGTRPTARWTAATAAAVAGSAVLIVGGNVEAGGQVVSGILFALLGGLLYAFYAIIAARTIDSGVRSGVVMGAMFGGAGVVLLPVLLTSDFSWLGTSGGLATAVYLGCATTTLACFVYGIGLRSTPVATAATLTLTEPAVAALLGVLVLGERLAGLSLAGLGLLAVALVIVGLPERRSRPGREAVPIRERAESSV
ncbi:DMT family transporter [Spongiactinospora sp. TRM90649]|uniref:DMT family transporter n=1 Tax=Spongiactinospora sp. TRM90649 TaxID=3031114 RepID=UPI0023F950D4|nr:DMT family transporter [Spongiactinospora sp. TRM90649]MDF5754996.1 DMT family transporter [Spongiactinospora sp. TRM90649]